VSRRRTSLWIAIGILAFVTAFAVVAGGFLWPRQQLEHGPWADPASSVETDSGPSSSVPDPDSAPRGKTPDGGDSLPGAPPP